MLAQPSPKTVDRCHQWWQNRFDFPLFCMPLSNHKGSNEPELRPRDPDDILTPEMVESIKSTFPITKETLERQARTDASFEEWLRSDSNMTIQEWEQQREEQEMSAKDKAVLEERRHNFAVARMGQECEVPSRDHIRSGTMKVLRHIVVGTTAVALTVAVAFFALPRSSEGQVAFDHTEPGLTVSIKRGNTIVAEFTLGEGEHRETLPEGNYVIEGPNSRKLYFSSKNVHIKKGEITRITIGSTENLKVHDGTGLIAEVFYGNDPGRRWLHQRVDPQINWAWGEGKMEPHCSNVDNVSIRWFGFLKPPIAGRYKFIAAADDGVILSIDGIRVIEQWEASSLARHTGHVNLSTDAHVIQVDYYQKDHAALMSLRWVRPDGVEEVIPSSCLFHAEDVANRAQPSLQVREDSEGLRAELFNGKNFEEHVASPLDQQIDFFWGFGSPSKLPQDGFSIRWTGFLTPPVQGDYELIVVSDDGIRVWLDNELIIDDWNNHYATRHVHSHKLDNRSYPLRVEYYEADTSAMCTLRWKRPGETDEEVIPHTALSEKAK